MVQREFETFSHRELEDEEETKAEFRVRKDLTNDKAESDMIPDDIKNWLDLI